MIATHDMSYSGLHCTLSRGAAHRDECIGVVPVVGVVMDLRTQQPSTPAGEASDAASLHPH